LIIIMSNVQSYNALIDRFKAFASGHFILKRFSHGQIEVSDLEKFGEYPFMHVVPSNVTYAKGMKTFSFQIVLADMPRDKEDKTEYQREVLSDLQRIAEDLVAEITNHRVLFGDLITVNNVSLEPFLEEFQHTLTGWTVSLDLLVPYYWDACSIPAEWNDFFESSTGGTGSILTFIDSITRDENGNVSLVNDEAEPSPNYYYGTNNEGVRGWYLLSDEVGLTCVTLPSCQTIIDIEAAIDLLQQDVIDLNADVALKANTADISAVGFSNDYNDLDNKPTIPNAQVNSDWNATSGVAEILNKPTIPTATSDLTNDGEDGVNPFITAQDLPDTSGFVPYTGATTNVNLGTHTLSAKDLVINHSSGSGVAASITKGGAGEALTVNKTSGSGNAMSVTGGVTQLSELHLTTDLADAYIASAATWNAKFNLPALTSGSVLFSNGTTIAQDNANLFWDDTNNRLGIGTTTPTSRLDVIGTFDALPVRVLRQASYGEILRIGRNGVSETASINYPADGVFAINTAASERMRVNASGNVLINTTTDAGFRLDVNGSVRATGSISAASAIARGTYLNQTLVATANNDVLVGLEIQPTFTLGAFTGVTRFPLRIRNAANTGSIFRVTNDGVISWGNGIEANNNSGFLSWDTNRALISSGTTSTDLDLQISFNTALKIFASTRNVVIQNAGTFTDIASARLAVNSTTQGFLPPRMTTTQKNAITSPVAGLMVYDTTLNLISVYNGTIWISL
jgi:hypothetical protein